MAFYIDLNRIPLDEFKNRLKTERLLPSQQVLKEKTDERFSLFAEQGIHSMGDLHNKLKNKKNLQLFVQETGFPEDFLTILRRELNSYQPAKRAIKDFPEIQEHTWQALAAKGIKTTYDLYPSVCNKEERHQFFSQNKISAEEGSRLTRLTDVTRLRYVNPAFANLLIHSSFDRIELIQKANPQALFENLLQLNEDKKFFKGSIGQNDMELVIRDSQYIATEIQY